MLAYSFCQHLIISVHQEETRAFMDTLWANPHGCVMAKHVVYISTAVSLLSRVKAKYFPHSFILFSWYCLCVSAGLPNDSGCDLCTEEDAQVADCVGGKHADDGEGDREVLIQCT